MHDPHESIHLGYGISSCVKLRLGLVAPSPEGGQLSTDASDRPGHLPGRGRPRTLGFARIGARRPAFLFPPQPTREVTPQPAAGQPGGWAGHAAAGAGRGRRTWCAEGGPAGPRPALRIGLRHWSAMGAGNTTAVPASLGPWSTRISSSQLIRNQLRDGPAWPKAPAIIANPSAPNQTRRRFPATPIVGLERRLLARWPPTIRGPARRSLCGWAEIGETRPGHRPAHRPRRPRKLWAAAAAPGESSTPGDNRRLASHGDCHRGATWASPRSPPWTQYPRPGNRLPGRCAERPRPSRSGWCGWRDDTHPATRRRLPGLLTSPVSGTRRGNNDQLRPARYRSRIAVRSAAAGGARLRTGIWGHEPLA